MTLNRSTQRIIFLLAVCAPSDCVLSAPKRHEPAVLVASSFKHYVDHFNRDDEELYAQHIPNDRAWEFLAKNIPLFECPDKDIERTYYFRWWTYRKHIKQTPDGFVITEFLPKVGWSGMGPAGQESPSDGTPTRISPSSIFTW